MTERRFARVPLLFPSTRLLRASALWITAANWAEALAEIVGAAEVLAGDRVLTAEAVREELSGLERSAARRRSRTWRTSRPAIRAETLIKDCRWLLRGRLRPDAVPSPERYRGTPIVWQHHDPFHTRGRALADRLGVPLVQYVDAPYVWEARRWGIRRPGWEWLMARFGDGGPLRAADLVLVVSEEVGEAVKQFGVDPSRVMVTQCTADLRYFDRGRRDDTRAALGLGDAFVIGWVGTFRPFHALDLLLDSFEAVASAEPQCHLLLVGDGPMATHVRERVRAAGLENRVTFTGSVTHTQVGAYVAAFDVAVLQAQSAETFHYSPMKMREYMAAGVPVVGVDAGDVRRTITRSGAGWLVPAGDAAALAERLLQAARNPEGTAATGRIAAEFAARELGTVAEARRVLEAAAAMGRS
ncbi:MAG TPA: glycosyltransferase family 4 protein [Longimicrobiales bacterium]|nr:glycosyltransferase family 4 protein [Longimicrobiales bacterium]